MSLRFKFAFTIALLQLGLAGVLTGFVLRQDHERAERQLIDGTSRTISLMAGMLKTPLEDRNRRNLEDAFCQELVSLRHVLYVEVRGPGGTVRARRGTPGTGPASDTVSSLLSNPAWTPRVLERRPAPRGLLHMEGHTFELAVSIRVESGGPRHIIAGLSTRAANVAVIEGRRVVFEAVGLGILLSVLVGICLDRKLVQTLRELSIATGELARGNLRPRLRLDTADELQELAEAFNHMAEELKRSHDELKEANETLESRVEQRSRELAKANAQLLQAAKLASLGKMAGGLAHELNTPIANVAVRTECLLEELEGDGLTEDFDPAWLHSDLKVILENARRASDIVSRLLLMGRSPERAVQAVRLEDLIPRTLALLQPVLDMRRVSLEVSVDPGLPALQADPDRLAQVLINLVNNGVDAAGEGGSLRVSAGRRPDEGSVVLEVEDSGPGVPKELRDRLFDPFYTTKPAGKGTGLGLSISQQIVRNHRGEIRLADSPLGGASFQVVLPASPRDRRAKSRGDEP